MRLGSWCRWIVSCVYSFYYVYLAHSASSAGFGGRAVFHLTVWIGKIPGASRISYSAFWILKHFSFSRVRNNALTAAFWHGGDAEASLMMGVWISWIRADCCELMGACVGAEWRHDKVKRVFSIWTRSAWLRTGAPQHQSWSASCLTLAPSARLDLIRFPPHLQNPVKLPSAAAATYFFF